MRSTTGGASALERDPFDHLHARVNDLHVRLDSTRQRMLVPTIPVYDSKHWPDDAIRGQVVRDINDMDTLWFYNEDDKWHQIGAISRCRLWRQATSTQFVTTSLDAGIVNFDAYYNPYEGVFQVGGGLPGGGYAIYIQSGGVYTATYRIYLYHSGGDTDYNWPMTSQIWEPDWDGFLGYRTWHDNWGDGIWSSVTFSVSNEVLTKWPSIIGQPPGQVIYCAVALSDFNPRSPGGDPPTNVIIEGGGGSYQGSYLEVVRHGSVLTEDFDEILS